MKLAPAAPDADLVLSDAAVGGFRSDPVAVYRAVRETTQRLCAPLSPEDAVVQSMPDASPAKWHLAHTTWFFETFVLEDAVADHRAFDPAFRVLFNSYYQSVGEQHPRPQRGLLTRPPLERVRAYRAHVDRQLEALLASDTKRVAERVELGLHHEQQHQELLLTDVKHLLSCNPLRPVYAPAPPRSRASAVALAWHGYEGGERFIGHAGDGFAFDNEGPRHRVRVESFELASRLVTNAEYLAFVEAGGYERPELWLADGFDRARSEGWRAPLYWERRDGAWHEFTLGGLREIGLEEPVTHVSYYEADAFARFASARLPSEMEWEVAAAAQRVDGGFLEGARLHPSPAAWAAEAAGAGPLQLFGEVWQWTRSAYAPYPRFRAPEGALGEYNGKFMANQMVLRGASCATPRSHARPSYRNFFHPDKRWQFSGIRLARDAA